MLQPGLPSPTMIPAEWQVLIIDLKDWFFTIPLHPDDYEKFPFSVPAINKGEPMKRYHWVVLPHGMKNSPTMCQLYVVWALEPFRQKYYNLIVYHCMDDTLIAGQSLDSEEILAVINIVITARIANCTREGSVKFPLEIFRVGNFKI